MSHTKKLPIYYLGQIKDALDSWQLDTTSWLVEHNLSNECIYSIDKNIDYQTFESLIVSAINMSKEASLGLHVGSRLSVTTHGMMGYAMINSSSIKEAINIFQSFINTRTPLITVDVIESSSELTVQVNELFDFSPIRQAFHETVMLTLINILSYISFGEINITKVSFGYPAPSYAKQYKDFFSCEVLFSQSSTKLTIGLSGLDRPLKMSDPSSLKQARNLCEQELEKMGRVISYEQKIKVTLINTVGEFPSLEKLSARFHVSPRTLHRYLKNEGTSYKKIVEEVSFQLSKKYLAETNISIQEIAYLLGYKDIANFRRAFKRWSGVPPSKYRIM